jgi:hypothetical protein
MTKSFSIEPNPAISFGKVYEKRKRSSSPCSSEEALGGESKQKKGKKNQKTRKKRSKWQNGETREKRHYLLEEREEEAAVARWKAKSLGGYCIAW